MGIVVVAARAQGGSFAILMSTGLTEEEIIMRLMLVILMTAVISQHYGHHFGVHQPRRSLLSQIDSLSRRLNGHEKHIAKPLAAARSRLMLFVRCWSLYIIGNAVYMEQTSNIHSITG